MNIRDPEYHSHSNQQFSEIDGLCDRFDQELLSGQSPRIETFLADVSEDARDGLFTELLAMEIEYHVQQGEDPRHDDYLRRSPQHASAIARFFPDATSTQFLGDETVSTTVDNPPDLKNFRLIRELGSGGMGVVWLAEQLRPVRRQVALKLIKAELTSRDVIARFDAEKQALAMMDHPHIASVLDAGTADDGRPYFVMELVDGIPITDYCDAHKLSVAERLKLFVPVCNAVQHAHQKGVIHRDLKPSNVLVTVIDGVAVPKVIDFGLAKAVEQSLQLTDVTMHTEYGKVVGTLQYMSPEQAELKGVDAEDVDTRTDVYSLGVMLYELLTGSTPVEKDVLARTALLKVLEIIRGEDPPRPSHRLSSSSNEASSEVGEQRSLHPARLQQLLRGDLDWVVMKALEKDRSRRYQTANDLAQEIASFLSGDAVSARPPSTRYQLQKFANRNRGLVAAVLAIGVVLLAGIAGTGYGLIQSNQKTKLAEDNAREATRERGKAVAAEKRATAESQRARDAAAAANFQLAFAKWGASRPVEARRLLHLVPLKFRDNFEWHYCKRLFEGSDITCYGHTSDVYEVAFTPDGTRVVSVSGDRTIKSWDATTGKQLGSLEGHTGSVRGLAVSPDGSRIASGGHDDNKVAIWDAERGELVRSLAGHAASINSVAFSPLGDRFASASDDSTIKLWDAKTGKEIISITGHAAGVTGVAFSPDGKHLASTSKDQSVRIWDPQSGEQIAIVREGRADTRRVAFSPDGTRFVTISNARFTLWDAQTWQLVAEDRIAHRGFVRCVAFSPDGTQFATAGEDTRIKLWDARSGKQITTLIGHAQEVWSVAYSPDGSRLASGASDGTVRIWDVRGRRGLLNPGGEQLTLRAYSDKAHCVTFSPDGRLLASAGAYGSIILRNAETCEVLFQLEGHRGRIDALSFSPGGTRLASAGDDETIRIWDTETGVEVDTFDGNTKCCRAIAFSPDGTRFVRSDRDGAINTEDAESHEPIARFYGHFGLISSIAFSPNGTRLASASHDKTVRLWDALTGDQIRTLWEHKGLVRSVAFGPRGERLVSGGNDPKVRVWDVVTGEQIATLEVTGDVLGVAYSSDGQRIATAGFGRLVSLFDAVNGREVLNLDAGVKGVSAVAFHPGGTRLAAATHDGSVRIWNGSRKHETATLSGHIEPVTTVTFSADGSLIYSESENEKLVWDFANRTILADGKWDPPKVSRRTSPDGRWFVTTEAANVVLVDLDYRNAADETGWRASKANFDAYWHQEQAEAATAARNWYSAAFHNAWLIKHDPGSMKHHLSLKSLAHRLVAQHPDFIDTRLKNVTGNGHGTFHSSQRKQLAPTVPASLFATAVNAEESAGNVAESNHALRFDGASYVDLGNPEFYRASFTVEGWIKPKAAQDGSDASAVFTVREGEQTALAAEVLPNGRFRVIHRYPPSGAGGINLYCQSDIRDDSWHHFAVVRDDTRKLHLYVDGSLAASSEELVPDLGETRYSVVLGMNVKTNLRYFRGLMDEIRFWNVAKTREEIVRDSNKRIDSESKGLESYFNFERVEKGSNIEPKTDTHFLVPPVMKSLETTK